METFYPAKVNERFCSQRHSRRIVDGNALGVEASFVCGSFVRFSLRIDTSLKAIAEAAFQTNGCGFMIAAADVLADAVTGRRLTELHGLNDAELQGQIENELDSFPQDRRHCGEACVAALHAAFADHRTRQVEEFRGENALICTCFGISEETIESCISENGVTTVEAVTDRCKAGSGCGSCRMLIQEVIDIRQFE
jgi:NifU-like protein